MLIFHCHSEVNYTKLLFWNLAKHENSQILSNLIIENKVDVAVLCEYAQTNIMNMESIHSKRYLVHDGNGGCDKVTLVSTADIAVTVRREQNRYTIYSIKNAHNSYIIAAVHLQANPYADADIRKNTIRELVHDISELECELGCNNTIVIGDMNANPFDSEMTAKDAFNAVLYKQLIFEQEYVKVNEKEYRRFYNPALDYISESKSQYGSYYRSGDMATTYWHCFDQVIVRKPLVGKIVDMYYCKAAGGKSLLARVGPNKEISDHLPLVLCIGEEG